MNSSASSRRASPLPSASRVRECPQGAGSIARGAGAEPMRDQARRVARRSLPVVQSRFCEVRRPAIYFPPIPAPGRLGPEELPESAALEGATVSALLFSAVMRPGTP